MNGRHPLARADAESAATLRALDGSFRDYIELQTGCRFVYATPQSEPALWEEYLAGALESYARHDVLSALEYPRIRDGSTTSLFTVAIDSSGAVVGGVRTQGPYVSPDQSHAVAEWAGHPGEALLWGDIEDRLPAGVVESKSGWVSAHSPVRGALSIALSRAVLHSGLLMGTKYVLGTAPKHALRMWESTGCRISTMIPAVPYPDDRYETVVLWWDVDTAPLTIDLDNRRALAEEWAQLVETGRPVPRVVAAHTTAA